MKYYAKHTIIPSMVILVITILIITLSVVSKASSEQNSVIQHRFNNNGVITEVREYKIQTSDNQVSCFWVNNSLSCIK